MRSVWATQQVRGLLPATSIHGLVLKLSELITVKLFRSLEKFGFFCMYMYVCQSLCIPHKGRYPKARGSQIPWNESYKKCELPNVGARNRTSVL